MNSRCVAYSRVFAAFLALVVGLSAATISSLSNSPDPFDNTAGAPANTDTINITLSTTDDLRIGIYNSGGTELKRRLYADVVGGTSTEHYWDGTTDAIPAYAQADTLEYGTYLIRAKSSLSSAYHSSIKGSGITIDDIWDVATDPEGHIYFSDQTKGLIHKIDTAGNLLLKINVAASPLNISGFDISGLTVDDSLNIFFADRGNGRITKLYASTSYATADLEWNQTAVTTTLFGLGTDGTNVWLADRGDRYVSSWLPDGTRDKHERINGCLDVALDNEGFYYVCEVSGTHELRKIRVSDDYEVGSLVVMGGNGQPAGIAVDTVNDFIVVAGYSADSIVRYNLSGGSATAIAGPGSDSGQVDGPSGVAVLPDAGKIIVADRINNRVQMFNISDGSLDKIINTDNSNIISPEGLAIDNDGNIYVASYETNEIKKYNSAGVFITSMGEQGSGAGQLDDPRGVAVDDSGHVYVTEWVNNRVQRFSKVDATTYSSEWTYGITNPAGAFWGPDSVLYVTGVTAKSVYKLSNTGALIDQITESDMENNPGGQQVNVVVPSAIAVDYQHNIYVGDYNNGDVFKGTIQDGNNNPSSYNWARIVATNDVFRLMDVDRYGNIYVTVTDDDEVRIYSSNGSLVHSWGGNGTGNGEFDDPIGIALTPNESAVWVVDKNNNRVQKFNLSFADTEDELVTIGDASGPPGVSSVTFKKTSDGTTLTDPLSAVYNSVSGDSGVTFVVTFSEAMDTSVEPTVTLKDADLNTYSVDSRAGTLYNKGWVKAATNVWEGYVNIPTGHDGLATVYVQNAEDAAGTVQSPNPDGTNTVTLDTETPMPSITSPSNNSSTIESAVPVAGTCESDAMLVLRNYDASSGGSVVDSVTGVEADGSGNWSVGTINLALGANYLAAVAVDGAGNTSVETNPRTKITRTNVLPGSIELSPSSGVTVGDSAQWTFTYTAASSLNDGSFLKVGIPAGWSDPQVNDTLTAGYVSATAGSGTTLDATAVEIVNIDTVQVNITSMSNGTTFDLYYGHSGADGYAQATAGVTCGSNTFSTLLNDSISIDPPSLTVNAQPLGVYHLDAMPESTLVNTNDVTALYLSLDNGSGLKSKSVGEITVRCEKSGGTAVAGNSRMSAVRIKDGSTTYGTATPGPSSDITVALSTDIEVPAGDTVTVQVRCDIINNDGLADSTLQLSIVDSADISATETASAATVAVVSSSGAFPRTSSSTVFYVPVASDSLLVDYADLMPVDSIGELENGVSAMRLMLRHPTAGGSNIEVTRLEFTMTPADPSSVIAKKILRRKGASTNLYSSSTIESSSPLTFDLSTGPISLSGGGSDTIDVLFDVVASPSGTIQFTLQDTGDIQAEDASTGFYVNRYENGSSFPFTSGTGSFSTGGTTTPSGKTVSGTLDQWDLVDEQLETSGGGADAFYATWDNSNVYFVWTGRDLSSAGDLFIYMSTGSGGATSTWNYGSAGIHYLPTGINGANYVFYYDNNSAKGLRNGSSSYSSATFSGEVTAVGDTVEIRLPRIDIGAPDTINIIPFIQSEGSAEILTSMPCDGVGEFYRNPTGLPSQTFLSWMTLPLDVSGETPAAATVNEVSSVVTPTWTYDGGAGNYAVSMTVGASVLYAGIEGLSPRIVSLNPSNGNENWSYALSGGPTSVALWYDTIGGANTYAIAFCVGNNLYGGHNNGGSYSALSWSTVNIGSQGGTPVRGIPPDGGNWDPVYAYVPCGDGYLRKYNVNTGGLVWQSASNLSANPDCKVAVQSDKVFVGCTNGNVVTVNTSDGSTLNSYGTGASVNNRITYVSSVPAVYVAPANNSVYSLSATLSSRWSLNLGATTYGAPYYSPGSSPPTFYCPAGNYMRKITDNTSSGSIVWTYQTTNTIASDPVEFSGVVYFSSDDKRNFALNASNGSSLSGWPSAVLQGENRSRVVIDNASSSVYFGGGDGKIYRYAKQ